MGGGVVVWVGTYSAHWGVFALAVVVAKLLAEFALVAWACWEIFFRFVLLAEDCYSISQEALDLCPVLHCYHA